MLQRTGEDDPALGTGVGAPGFGTQSLAQQTPWEERFLRSEVEGGLAIGRAGRQAVQQQLKSPPCRLSHCLKP